MRLALGQAELAFAAGEVPVGAVLVRDGKLTKRQAWSVYKALCMQINS